MSGPTTDGPRPDGTRQDGPRHGRPVTPRKGGPPDEAGLREGLRRVFFRAPKPEQHTDGHKPDRAPLPERATQGVMDRTGTTEDAEHALNKVFPSHFSFLWGEIALYSFVVLVATGIFLTLFFEGSQKPVIYEGSYEPLRGQKVSAAFNSVMRISHEIPGGLLIRQMHHWAALVFIGAIALHLARVYFTGAFRKPRDLNWIVGVLLLLLGIGAGITGYSLPDDLLSGNGMRITQALVLAVPVIGQRLSNFLLGGEWPGPDLIGRLYPTHILLIQLGIFAVLGLHLLLVWKQKHTQFRGPGRTERNVVGERVWPAFAMKSIALLFGVSAFITAMAALFEINAVWLYGPYESGAATSFAQPDWYAGFLEGALRLFPPWETRIGPVVINNLVYAGMIPAGIMFGILFMVPWIERRFTGDHREHHLLDRPRDRPLRTAFGTMAITIVGVLLIGGAQDTVANTFKISVGRMTTLLQWTLLIAPPVVFLVTRWLCEDLRTRAGADRTERAGLVLRDAGGGYEHAHEEATTDDGHSVTGATPATTGPTASRATGEGS